MEDIKSLNEGIKVEGGWSIDVNVFVDEQFNPI